MEALQQLVRELVISDNQNLPSDVNNENFDQISYTIKTIFQSGKEEAFTEQLNQFIEKKEAEIEKMCNFHYQEFVQSVDQLLKVRQGTINLRSKIVELNTELQEAGTKFVEKKKEMIEHRRTLLNIEIAMEALQTCLFVLDVANKIIARIDGRKYYSALRMLDELQNVHLRHVSQYSFSKQLQEFVPIQKDNIKAAVLKEVREWFQKTAENTKRMGRTAITSFLEKQRDIRSNSGGKEHKGEAPATLRSLEALMTEGMNVFFEAFDDASVVDFKPLYQAIHIFTVLGKRKELRSEYEEKRNGHLTFLMQASVTFHDGQIFEFENYLYEVAGFFIIEAIVMNTTQDFSSRILVDHNWDKVLAKLNVIIGECLSDCHSPDLFVNIKLDVVAFVQILEGYGYSLNDLKTMMLSLFDRYTELIKSRCSEQIIETIEEEDYSPMIVNRPEEYEAVLAVFRIKEDKKLSMRFYQFAEGFDQQHNEIDDLLKKSLENLLIQTLGTAIVSKLTYSNLSQAVQIIANMEYFELASGEFEELLTERRSTRKGAVNLQATQTFKDLKLSAERRIFELINNKIDEFLQLADYDWISTKPLENPSSYLQDLLNYITLLVSSTFASQPTTFKNFVYFNACDHLATSLKDLLVNKSGKKMSLQFIDNFDSDIKYLEGFIAGLNDVNIGDTFTEIRQIMVFLKSENYEDFLNPAIKSKKYSRIRNANLVTLLEKLKVDSSFLTKMTPAEKARRKSIDVLLKEGLSRNNSCTLATTDAEMDSIFYISLRNRRLEQFYDNFIAFGIDSMQKLVQLTMQDYGVVGVVSMEDRKSLCWQFEFIQQMKQHKDDDMLMASLQYESSKLPTTSFLPKPSSSALPIPKSSYHHTSSIQTTMTTSTSTVNVTSTAGQESVSLWREEVAIAQIAAEPRSKSPAPVEKIIDQDDHDNDSDASYEDNDRPERSFRKRMPGTSHQASPGKKASSLGLNAYGVPTSFKSLGRSSQKTVSASDTSDKIRVCVRKRPLNKKELKSNQVDIAIVNSRRVLTIHEPKVKVDLTKYVEQHEFTFDEVFDCNATNQDVYLRTAYPLVEYAFNGSGKTFTMLDETNGLYVLAGRDIFSMLQKEEYSHLCAYVSFYEIYQSHLYDLLNSRKRLYAREDGKQQVCIVGIQEYQVDNVQTLMEIFDFGNNARSTGATGANADSSRSHAIFQIVLKHKKHRKKVQGKLSFIDLAGSERGADRGDADKQTRMEGSEINKSLLALKECIRALDQDSKHTPFRQSKLTQVLKDSFIGNSRTCMIATVSPNIGNSEHSLNTLRYAYRVKELKGDGSKDESSSDLKFQDFPSEGDLTVDADEQALLDSEFPPDNLVVTDGEEGDADFSDDSLSQESETDENISSHQVRKLNILSQVNSRQQQKFSSPLHQNSSQALDGKAATARESAADDKVTTRQSVDLAGLEELISLHRQHIRVFNDLSKADSRLIVQAAMKPKTGGNDRSVALTDYIGELESILNQKMESIAEMQRCISKLKK
ncbi:hypothetical protein HDU76_008439 [Blyttiomyces sp. JEL0837]|nr:hypothetical protein HDU76_008439 [Blyttiomyces sp. JEL0837]